MLFLLLFVVIVVVFYPFLSVRVGEVVEGARVPLLAESEQEVGLESVLGHDDEVDEESGGRLHHAHLAVRHGNQSGSVAHRVQTDTHTHRQRHK